MTPERARAPLGWNDPARGSLILIVATLSASLAWASRGTDSPPAPVPSLVVDANTAPAPVLMALPTIGPAMARLIVEAREASPFRSIEDFDRRVKGIGPARVAALRPYLRFEPSPVSPP